MGAWKQLCRVGRRALSLSALSQEHSAMSSSSLEDYFVPPEEVRGSKVLDKAAFLRDFELPAISLARPNLCSMFIKKLGNASLKFPWIKSVLTEPNPDGKEPTKVLLLVPHHLMKKPLSSTDHEWIAANGGEEVTRVVSLAYDRYSRHAILKAILPTTVMYVPGGFELVGHIVHYNLREEHLPYRYIIGQVTLDKELAVRTVVNKIDQIDNVFRFFKMEVLAGEQDFIATVKENMCTFTFDFSCVYWNSRLSDEHSRILTLLQQGDVVLDMFAGVGPFAVPAAKCKGCTVYANDLNPESFKYLKENARKNHVSKLVLAYNLDARAFVTSIARELVDKLVSSAGDTPLSVCSHVIMNLPASSVQFLDAFRGLFCGIPEETRPSVTLPLVHCYCFVKVKHGSDSELEGAALQQVITHLGVKKLSPGSYFVETVRLVSPKKSMMRVSFRLPEEVAYGSDQLGEGRPVMSEVQKEGAGRSRVQGEGSGVLEETGRSGVLEETGRSGVLEEETGRSGVLEEIGRSGVLEEIGRSGVLEEVEGVQEEGCISCTSGSYCEEPPIKIPKLEIS